MNRELSFRIKSALCGLILLDATISVVAFFCPQLWFTVFHGVQYVDPEGFLRRCAANWAAFAFFQAVALVKWKRQPHWLAVVAGLRLGDMFTDWTYLLVAHDTTGFGKISLFLVSPANLVLGVFFLQAFKRVSRSQLED